MKLWRGRTDGTQLGNFITQPECYAFQLGSYATWPGSFGTQFNTYGVWPVPSFPRSVTRELIFLSCEDQGKQDLNLQPTDLKSATLPIELFPLLLGWVPHTGGGTKGNFASETIGSIATGSETFGSEGGQLTRAFDISIYYFFFFTSLWTVTLRVGTNSPKR